MRNAHRFDPFNAMARPRRAQYYVGMNSSYYVSSTSHSATLKSQDAHLDTHSTKLKAIERWENEGGKLL